jgi:predicted SAM-dependent methyltransferase
MIGSLKRRAARAGLSEHIDARVCSSRSLEIHDLAGEVDLALAFHVVHEVSDVSRLMTEVHRTLKPEGRLFVAEPRGHVSASEYESTEAAVQRAGFVIADRPTLKRDRATVFVKT